MRFSALASLFVGSSLLAACSMPDGDSMNRAAPVIAAQPATMGGVAASARMVDAASNERSAPSTVSVPRPEPVVQNRPGLGTAMGEITSSPTRIMVSERMTPASPNAVASIRYNNRENMSGMAIGERDLSRTPVVVRITENGRACTVELALRSGSDRIYPMGPRYTPNNQFFAAGEAGQTYTIGIANNNCTYTYEAVTTVDGLDVITGQAGSIRNGGYLVEPGKNIQIAGFRVSTSSIATFRFDSVANSYAARPGSDARNIGVIGIALFAQRPSAETIQRNNANPFPADQPRR